MRKLIVLSMVTLVFGILITGCHRYHHSYHHKHHGHKHHGNHHVYHK